MPKGLTRLSPGVYRNPQGQLVRQQQQQPQRPSMQVPQPKAPQPGMQTMPYNFPPGTNPSAMYEAMRGMQAGAQQQPTLKMPAPLGPPLGQNGYGAPGQVYAGGSPNFNEMTEQYDPNLAAITQASMAGMQQFGQMPKGQLQQPQTQQMMMPPFRNPNNGNTY